MTGAGEDKNGAAGLVPQPAAGQHELFLRGDATWAKPVAELSIEDKNTIDNLQTVTSTLIGNDEGMSVREIATAEVAELVAGADESFNTLKEIADWIMNDTTGAASMANDIVTLKTDVQTLSTGLSDLQSTVESLDYVSTTLFNETVGDLSLLKIEDENGDLVEANLVDGIVDLQQRMKWQELK